MDYIKKMNKMFEANPWTDKGRVKIDYAPNSDVVVVKVLDKVETINNLDEYTDYGIMFAIMEKVDEMYNS